MRFAPGFFAAHCLLLTAHCHLMTLSALASTFGGIVRPIFDKQTPKSEYPNAKQTEMRKTGIQNPKRPV